MYTLIRQSSLRQLLLQQAPTLTASLAIAELFYKFHSFTLECVAFLATWFVIDLVAALLTRLTAPERSDRRASA